MFSNKLLYKIGFNTAVQILGKFLSVALGFITVFLLTRYLGEFGYGEFTLAFTYVSFFSLIADFGLQSTMVRELAQNGYRTEEHGSFLFLKIILVLLSSIVAFLVLFFFPYSISLKLTILIAILAVTVSGITTYGSIIFQSRLRLDLVTFIDVITKLFTVISIVFFVILKLNLYFIVASVLLGNLVGLFISIFLLRGGLSIKYNFSQVKNILIASLPVGITSSLGLAYFKIDTIMLSLMKTANEVGIYSLSYKILENLLLIWAFYLASVYPILSHFKGAKKFVEMKELLFNSSWMAIVIAIPIIILGFMGAPFIITIFGGVGFHRSIPSLQILVFSLPFLFINNLYSDFFIIHKENRINIIGLGLSLITNVILNLIFIPMYGFIGASYVTVLSAAVFSIYCIIRITFFDKNKFYES